MTGYNAGNLKIIVPMVSTITELREFHAVLDDTIGQLHGEGIQVARPEVGIMVEVPAAISQLEKWKGYIEFLSVGSNDLSQYLTAVDRNNPTVASKYDHLHPAVVAEIARVVDAAERLDLPVSVCGEMASDPEAVVILVGMGIRRLSMSASQLPKIKWLIRAMKSSDTRMLYQAACKSCDSSDIRKITSEYLSELDYLGLAH